MVFYTLTVIFSYVSTKWLFQKISIPPWGKLTIPPFPFMDILHKFKTFFI